MRTLLIAFLMTLATQAGADTFSTSFKRHFEELHYDCIWNLTKYFDSRGKVRGNSSITPTTMLANSPYEGTYTTQAKKNRLSPPNDYAEKISNCNKIIPLEIVLECRFYPSAPQPYASTTLILASKHRRIAVPKYFYIPVISVSEKKVSSLYLARVDTVGLIYKNGKRLKQNIPSLQSFVFGGTGASGSMFLSDHFYLMGRSMLKTYPWEFQFFNGLKIDRYTGMMSWEWYDAENKSVIEMLGECNKLSSFEDSNYDEVKEFVDDGMKFLANIVVDHYKALPKFEMIEKKKKF